MLNIPRICGTNSFIINSFPHKYKDALPNRSNISTPDRKYETLRTKNIEGSGVIISNIFPIISFNPIILDNKLFCQNRENEYIKHNSRAIFEIHFTSDFLLLKSLRTGSYVINPIQKK